MPVLERLLGVIVVLTVFGLGLHTMLKWWFDSLSTKKPESDEKKDVK